MNSIENIIKPVEAGTIIKENSKYDFDKYISPNYNYIDNALEVNGRCCIKKVVSVMSRFKYVNCGVEILSMSERIMNKVFDVSNGCGVKIHYQDTASVHLHYDDVDKIAEKKFNQKHNQGLVGDGFNNFQVHFSMDGAATEIYGVEIVFLCKKQCRHFRTNR